MPRVLGLVHVHENNALHEGTVSYCHALQRAGYATDIINLSAPDGGKRLAAAIASGDLKYCFGLQGVGSRLEVDGANLWTKTQIPFLCVHFDNPCYQPLNHYSLSPYVANLYQCASFLEIQRRYIGGDQISGVLPFEIPELHHTPEIPFDERPYKLMYLKTGGGVAEFKDYFDSLPGPVGKGAWDIVAQAVDDPNLLICDLVAALFERTGYDRRKQEKDFWAVVQSIDFYLRRKRAIDFVEWLKFQDGAVIVGGGWEFIDKEGSRAQFLPALSSSEAFLLYEKSQFVCNTNPYGPDVIHERMVWGLLMNSCVLSDSNAWWDRHFSTVPSLVRFVWNEPLQEQLEPILADGRGAARVASGGRPAAMQEFYKNQTASRFDSFVEQIKQATRG